VNTGRILQNTESFLKKFNVTDYWNWYEWQARGSSLCHDLYWMEGVPEADMEDEAARKRFTEVWGFHISAVNPERNHMP
jgi:hypothetical protein